MNRPEFIPDFKWPSSLEDIGLPVARSGVVIESNAGWRSLRPVLAADKCVACMQCYMFCPDGAIMRDADTLSIDYDFCKGCGICARECRVKAISMVSEEEFDER